MSKEKSFVVNFTTMLGLERLFECKFIPTTVFQKMELGKIVDRDPFQDPYSSYKERTIIFYGVGDQNVTMIVISESDAYKSPSDPDQGLRWFPSEATIEVDGRTFKVERRSVPVSHWTYTPPKLGG